MRIAEPCHCGAGDCVPCGGEKHYDLKQELAEAEREADDAWARYDALPEDSDFLALTEALLAARDASDHATALSRELDSAEGEGGDWHEWRMDDEKLNRED